MREDEVPLLEEGSEGSVIQRIWVELKKIWQIAGPAIFSRVALYAMTLIYNSSICRTFGKSRPSCNLHCFHCHHLHQFRIFVGYGKRVGEEFLFIMSRILVGFDIDTVMGSAVIDAVVLFRGRDPSHLNKSPLDCLTPDMLDRTVKALDVCNIITRGIDMLRHWHRLAEIALSALK
ncbi:hypothetical protein NE237_005783 [Protea cynaroides]|uniref:Uncharacterized protein n=1 Tax=Protea cynaroides TaxID=273540 RepID=A0A9Q0KLV2_9MAGN|nr:hypothetical protein NE237_005783 [Protea cynaroides]